MISDKLLKNQRKHQRRILFDEWDDNAPFQWNGNIESVIYTLFEVAGYEDKEPIWEESIRSELTFNHDNKVVECVRYNDGKQCSRCLNDYNQAGLLVLSNVFDKYSRLIHEIKYDYNDDNNVITCTSDSYDHHNKFVYIYDSFGNLVQQLTYDNGKLYKGTTYLYNEYGNVISSAELFPNGQLGVIMSYIYDKVGNIRTEMYDYEEKDYTRFKYDSEGKIIETIRDGFKPKLFSIVSHHKTSAVWIEEFKYDDQGNVISMIAKNGDRLISRSEWVIRYRKR